MLTHGKCPHAKSNFHLRLSWTSSCGATPSLPPPGASPPTPCHTLSRWSHHQLALWKSPKNERHGSTGEQGHTRLVDVTRVGVLTKKMSMFRRLSKLGSQQCRGAQECTSMSSGVRLSRKPAAAAWADKPTAVTSARQRAPAQIGRKESSHSSLIHLVLTKACFRWGTVKLTLCGSTAVVKENYSEWRTYYVPEVKVAYSCISLVYYWILISTLKMHSVALGKKLISFTDFIFTVCFFYALTN